jgi:hypothetical protein
MRAFRLSLEPEDHPEDPLEEVPPRDHGRRGEITPERRVQFRPHGGLTPRERDHREERSEDEELGEMEEMDLLTLQRALRASKVKTAQVERALKEERRRSSMLSTPGGAYGPGPARPHTARPKLNTPHLFKGEYTETLNAYNWLHQLSRYLTQCKVPPEEYSSYARTYMSEQVQAWMDAEFGSTDVPEWDHFYERVVARYVPPDHDDRLERMFARMKQRDTLLNYIEQWQVLESALTFSHVQINTRRKIMGFIEGMKDRDDKYRVIQANPSSLQTVFDIVHDIRRAKILTRETQEDRSSKPTRVRSKASKKGRDDRNSYRRQLNKLEGAAKKRAWDEGACLNCGDKDHFIGQCPKLKSSIKSAVKKYAAFFSKDKGTKDKKSYSDKATAGSHKKLHKLAGSMATQAAKTEETASAEASSESDLTEASSSTSSHSQESEENSCSESEG